MVTRNLLTIKCTLEWKNTQLYMVKIWIEYKLTNIVPIKMVALFTYGSALRISVLYLCTMPNISGICILTSRNMRCDHKLRLRFELIMNETLMFSKIVLLAFKVLIPVDSDWCTYEMIFWYGVKLLYHISFNVLDSNFILEVNF